MSIYTKLKRAKNYRMQKDAKYPKYSIYYDTREINQISIQITFHKNLILYKNSTLIIIFVQLSSIHEYPS